MQARQRVETTRIPRVEGRHYPLSYSLALGQAYRRHVCGERGGLSRSTSRRATCHPPFTHQASRRAHRAARGDATAFDASRRNGGPNPKPSLSLLTLTTDPDSTF